jgi:hypothetical protein
MNYASLTTKEGVDLLEEIFRSGRKVTMYAPGDRGEEGVDVTDLEELLSLTGCTRATDCISMSSSEVDSFMDTSTRKYKITTDFKGRSKVYKMSKICGTCSAGYGINPPFPKNGKLCRGCMNQYYCSRDCQLKDWHSHKSTCDEMRQSREKADKIRGKVRDTNYTQTRPRVVKVCGSCGSVLSKARLCGGCKSQYYCNQECQSNDWENHKTICKQQQDEKKKLTTEVCMLIPSLS